MSFNQFFLVLKINILEKANANKLHIFLCVCVVCFYWQWGWSGWIRHRGLIEFKEPLLTGHSQWCGGLLTSWCAFARVCVFGMDRCVFICRGLLCVLSQVRRVFFLCKSHSISGHWFYLACHCLQLLLMCVHCMMTHLTASVWQPVSRKVPDIAGSRRRLSGRGLRHCPPGPTPSSCRGISVSQPDS